MDRKISIITVVFNARLTLEATIKSVLSQDKSLFEYWLIDGGSNDGSVEIIKKYSDQLAGWVSEPDSGIYDAMNKGIEKAQGKWIYFLGADDTLVPNILDDIKLYLIENYSLLFGDIMTARGRRVPSFLSLRTLMQNTVHHQGAFYNKDLFKNFRYNTQLRILSDYELNLKIYCNHLPVQKLPVIIACCQEGGASSDVDTAIKETNFIRESYINKRSVNKAWSMMLKVYYLQKRIRAYFSEVRFYRTVC